MTTIIVELALCDQVIGSSNLLLPRYLLMHPKASLIPHIWTGQSRLQDSILIRKYKLICRFHLHRASFVPLFTDVVG